MQDRDTGDFRLIRGPFEPEFFSRLPDQDWQLMVNNADAFVPMLADFKQMFDAIPRCACRCWDAWVARRADEGLGPCLTLEQSPCRC